MRKLSPSLILPILGAAGFVVFSELSLRQAQGFLPWSLATMAWIVAVFAALAVGRVKGRLVAVAVPAVLMISVSTVASLLFLDLVSPRRGFIVFFALVLYLFLEHVRHEIDHDSDEERLYIAEYARMVNIGALFLASTAIYGLAIFLPVSSWLTFGLAAVIIFLWSWHLHGACSEDRQRTWQRILLTTLVTAETFAVVQRLPLSMFVSGALVAVVYYLAADLLAASGDALSGKSIRRHIAFALIMIAILLVTARWVN